MEFICATADSDLSKEHIGGASSPETAAWLRTFLEAPNVGFALCDEDLRFIFINHALARMNGLPIEDHLGKTIQDVLAGRPTKSSPCLNAYSPLARPRSLN